MKKVLEFLVTSILTLLFCTTHYVPASTETDFIIDGDILISYVGSDTEVEIPEGIVTIKEGAFNNDCIEKIIMPDSVKNMASHMFNDYPYLKEVIFSKKLREISCCFDNCPSLEKVVFPEGTVDIYHSFNNCPNLKELELPVKIRNLDISFNECTGLESVSIPMSINSLDGFRDCSNLKTVILNKKNTIVYGSVFEGSPIKTIKSHDGCEIARFLSEKFGAKILSLDTYDNCDVDGNGEVEMVDVKRALEGSLGITKLNEIEIASSDFNDDGKMGLSDVAIVLKATLMSVS